MAREYETYRMHLERLDGLHPGAMSLTIKQVAEMEQRDPRTVQKMFNFQGRQISVVAYALHKAKKDAGVEPVYLTKRKDVRNEAKAEGKARYGLPGRV